MSDMADTQTVDLTYLNEILVKRMKVKRQPVAISYIKDGVVPDGYEPVNVVACQIVRLAEEGRKIYVDQTHHDCRVGQFHLGLETTDDPFIVEGEYLTSAQGFYTDEAAKCNKKQSYSLPEGTISALAAAPLDAVPEGMHVDLLVAIVNSQQAMQIAGAASVREGTFPHGELGASACSSIFAAPYHLQNSVFAIGDGGGRAFNRVAVGEMFVSIPKQHFRYIIELIENFRIDPQKMREVIMPSYAPKNKTT